MYNMVHNFSRLFFAPLAYSVSICYYCYPHCLPFFTLIKRHCERLRHYFTTLFLSLPYIMILPCLFNAVSIKRCIEVFTRYPRRILHAFQTSCFTLNKFYAFIATVYSVVFAVRIRTSVHLCSPLLK